MKAIESEQPTHLIINTDPGCDDAVSLFSTAATASKEFTEVDSIAIYGNDSTHQTGKNLSTLRVIIEELRQTGSFFPELKYFSGAEKALDKSEPFQENTDDIFGKHALEGIERKTTKLLEPSGVIYERIARNPEATAHALSLGAITELAQMITRKDMVGKVKSITVMGGVFFEEGNRAPHLSWNFSCDPRALEVVLRESEKQRIPFTLVPLDLTQKPELGLTADRFAWLYKELNLRGSHAIADIIKTLVGTESTYYKFSVSPDRTIGHRKPPYDRIGFKGAAIHDLTARMVQENPENFEIYPIQVLVDEKGQIGTAPSYMASDDFHLHTIQVAMDVKDSERYWQQVVDSLSQYR